MEESQSLAKNLPRDLSQFRDGVIASAGGVPLMSNGKIIGAIGVSGGPAGAVDSGPAQAGADVLK